MIKKQSIFNIEVPELRFDKKWPRVENAYFTEPAIDIYERLKTITSSDIFIVAPEGGDGTFLEFDFIIHENLINEILGNSVKHLIFIENENRQWSTLFQSRLENLDISKKDILEYPWIHFISFDKEIENSNIISQIFEIIKQID